MPAQFRTYTVYGLGCAVAWLIVLAIATTLTDEGKRRTLRLMCAGWWLGWLSATIARQVYPPPLRWRATS
jgi:hypothetical protein